MAKTTPVPHKQTRWPASMMVRQWKLKDGDTRCQKCVGVNPVWWVEDEVWNAVMGSAAGILCPACFIAEAELKGIGRTGAWQLYPPSSLR
jgi:hypothetical protein